MNETPPRETHTGAQGRRRSRALTKDHGASVMQKPLKALTLLSWTAGLARDPSAPTGERRADSRPELTRGEDNDPLNETNRVVLGRDTRASCLARRGDTPAPVTAGPPLCCGVARRPANDHKTHGGHVTSIEAAGISVTDGATGNGSDTTGSGQLPAKAAVGNYPDAIAVDPAAGPASLNGDSPVSVIALTTTPPNEVRR
jgi:hypothetical protein